MFECPSEIPYKGFVFTIKVRQVRMHRAGLPSDFGLLTRDWMIQTISNNPLNAIPKTVKQIANFT